MAYKEMTPSLVLHWNYRGFTEFPIQQLQGEESDITDIYFKDNLISRLPNDICMLENLQSLYLSGNDITELPREISKLRCLKCLDVSGNRLRCIPDEIGEVRSLKFLILDENELTALPLRLAEIRGLRYLSVCDNKLKWLPQRPIYNYHHCEFRFWRNPHLQTLPYSLWYHMFRDQQTRSLNIGCLSSQTTTSNNYKQRGHCCRLKLNLSTIEKNCDIYTPSEYTTILAPGSTSPPSLFELCKRQFYKIVADTAKSLTMEPYSIYSNYYCNNETNNNLIELETNFEDIDINNKENDPRDLNANNYLKKTTSLNIDNVSKKINKNRKNQYVPADLIEEYFDFLPIFVKENLCNGPVSRCENVNCKKPVFDFVYYEFCIGKIILIDNTEDVILSAAFCTKSCADIWKKAKDYFTGHQCLAPPEKISKNMIKCSRLRRFWLNISSVNGNDIRALRIYRSHAALCEDKYRNYRYFPFSIHPYSKLRHWLEATFVFVLILSNVIISIQYADHDPKHGDIHNIIVYVIDLLYLFNVLANFFTGYIEGNTKKFAVMDLKRICCRYARTWLAIDLLSSADCLSLFFDESLVTLHTVLVGTKLLRLPVLIMYLDNVLTVRRTEIKLKTILELMLLILSYLMWNIFFQFANEYIAESSFVPANPRNSSWMTIGRIWQQSCAARYIYSLDRAIGMLKKNANMNLINEGGCFESFFIIAWLIAKLLVFHCALKYTISAFGSESAQAKYYIMMKQVEMYMNHRNLPPRIKQKIMKFYAIKFQSNYFMESRMLNCISGQLYEDIVMHNSQQLVSEFKFVKHLPKPLLLQIALKLKLVIYIAGDIIFKINTFGDCLYFIDKGTVAIYSESGKELCHAEDGEYFGTISLILGKPWTASAVAVTNCEFMRLDREDFERTIAMYPTAYEEMKKDAIKRYETINVINEHHKAELKMADDQRERDSR